jgi:hypothetical protein
MLTTLAVSAVLLAALIIWPVVYTGKLRGKCVFAPFLADKPAFFIDEAAGGCNTTRFIPKPMLKMSATPPPPQSSTPS